MYIKIFIGIISILLLIAAQVGCNATTVQQPNSTTTTTTTTTSPPAGGSQSVSISNFAFSSQTLTVARGTTVTWTNNDSTTHTVTSDSGVFDSGNLSPGGKFSFTFNNTGTFPYHCNIHSTMKGTIIVQ